MGLFTFEAYFHWFIFGGGGLNTGVGAYYRGRGCNYRGINQLLLESTLRFLKIVGLCFDGSDFAFVKCANYLYQSFL